MERKSTSEETQGLSADDLCDHWPKAACGDLDVGRPAVLAREGGRWECLLDPSYVLQAGVAVPLPLLETIFISRSPGAVQPGDFFDTCRELQGTSWDEDTRRSSLPNEADAEQFHDSELGDVYDLYNACNGVMLGNLLDVRKLRELSAEEAEALDVKRLEKVWAHTATGCAICARVVLTLNEARGALRAGHANSPTDKTQK
jgi:hypothetical protein